MKKQLLLAVFFVLMTTIFAACRPAVPAAEVDHPVIVEITGDSLGQDMVPYFALLAQAGVDLKEVYRWKNHLLVYDFQGDTAALKSWHTSGKLTIYTDPYYVFDRSTCAEGQVDGPWEHKILTANLVADPVKQQEYLNYHKTQYEEWPEVSEGFCRAEFQQLLMYRAGRQMILIISIPAGKDYDTLNARTVENNPRGDDWNAMMGPYQEGIEGTAPGETWVFFERVK